MQPYNSVLDPDEGIRESSPLILSSHTRPRPLSELSQSGATSALRPPHGNLMASYMMSPYPPSEGSSHSPMHGGGDADAGVYAQYPSPGHPYPVVDYHHPPPDHALDYRASKDTFAECIALNEVRQNALKEINDAGISRYHIKLVLVVGAGFFTDAYNLFISDMAWRLLDNLYKSSESKNAELAFKVAAPVGTFIGMLVFGHIGDRLGRKRAYGAELLIIITSVFVQALLGQARSVNIIWTLVLWRFIMGIGIGGDYPTSAVFASEFAPSDSRGRVITSVFANQGLGQLTGALVSLALTGGYKEHLSDPESVDQMWRILVGFGCIPGVLALCFRFTIPETPRFIMDIERDVNLASQIVDDFLKYGTFRVDPDATIERVQAPKSSWNDWFRYISVRENLYTFVGTCYSWFALDIAFYGALLNSLLSNVFLPENADDTLHTKLRKSGVRNLVPIVAGLLPGYVAAFFLIDRWGRRPLQLYGFVALFVLFLIMGFLLFKSGPRPLIGPDRVGNAATALYCIASFFFNFGPNTTTFVIPAEAFPTRYRSTMHGVAAASGKLGAIIAQVIVNFVETDEGNRRQVGTALIVFAFIMLTGVASTWMMPETKQRTLEDISNEEQNNFITGPAQPKRTASRV